MKKLEISKMMGDLIRLTCAREQASADKFIREHSGLLFRMAGMLLQAEQQADGTIVESEPLHFSKIAREYAGGEMV